MYGQFCPTIRPSNPRCIHPERHTQTSARKAAPTMPRIICRIVMLLYATVDFADSLNSRSTVQVPLATPTAAGVVASVVWARQKLYHATNRGKKGWREPYWGVPGKGGQKVSGTFLTNCEFVSRGVETRSGRRASFLLQMSLDPTCVLTSQRARKNYNESPSARGTPATWPTCNSASTGQFLSGGSVGRGTLFDR
jgi:hypothetical protein